MSKPIPEFDTDIFSRESIRNANAVDDRLRELAPVVRLPGENITMLARYENVAAGLKDWKTFSSTSRPWHDPNSVRPELLLTDDPPKHTRVRAVVSNALSPKALNAHGARISAMMPTRSSRPERSRRRAASTRSRHHPGVCLQGAARPAGPAAWQGREHLSAFGNMVWATMGPMNEIFHEAMRDTRGACSTGPAKVCNRENLAPGSLGMAMYEAADAGE